MGKVIVAVDGSDALTLESPVGLKINAGEVEIIETHSNLAEGSLLGCRQKFSVKGQRAVIGEILNELDPTTGGEKLYLGDWTKGEVQITGLRRIIVNRFWCEPEYEVLFPPKPGKMEPAAGTYRCIRWNVGITPGVAALCITNDQSVVLVREFRHAARSWITGIPRGLRNPGESIEQCGLREANEESGVATTADSKVFDLGQVHPDTGVLMSTPRLICVTNVTVDDALRNRDVSESAMGTNVVSLAEIAGLIRSNDLGDGFTQAALLRATVQGLLSPTWLQ